MRNESMRTVACTLLAVALWAGAASSGNAEPATGEHGWVEAGVALSGSETRVGWGGCAMLPEGRGAESTGSCPLDWQMRALTIGGVGQAAEHLRRRLPVLSAIISERGTNISHWLALLPWNSM
jgi:hypothetical protein